MGRRRFVLRHTHASGMAEHGSSVGNAGQGSEYALLEPSEHRSDFLQQWLGAVFIQKQSPWHVETCLSYELGSCFFFFPPYHLRRLKMNPSLRISTTCSTQVTSPTFTTLMTKSRS